MPWTTGWRAGCRARPERRRSIYREALKPLLEHIGTRPLRELTARDVRRGLEALSERMSTRYLQLAPPASPASHSVTNVTRKIEFHLLGLHMIT